MTPGLVNSDFVNGNESAQAYQRLLLAFAPREIKTESEYDEVQSQIDRLIDKGELSDAEQEYLNLLGMLIYAYEEKTENKSEYDLRGVALIKGLMELYSLRQKDLLPIFKTESIVSDVLHGKRRLTTEHIDGLAAFFDLPHSLFFEPNQEYTLKMAQARDNLGIAKAVRTIV